MWFSYIFWQSTNRLIVAALKSLWWSSRIFLCKATRRPTWVSCRWAPSPPLRTAAWRCVWTRGGGNPRTHRPHGSVTHSHSRCWICTHTCTHTCTHARTHRVAILKQFKIEFWWLMSVFMLSVFQLVCCLMSSIYIWCLSRRAWNYICHGTRITIWIKNKNQ